MSTDENLCRAPFHAYDGWRYCEKTPHPDAPHYHEGNGTKIATRPVKTLGEIHAPAARRHPCAAAATIATEVWRRVLIDGKDMGYVDREKGRPVRDVVHELRDALGDMLDEGLSNIADWDRAVQRAYVRAEVYQLQGKWIVEWHAPGRVAYTPTRDSFDSEALAREHAETLRKLYAPQPTPLPVEPWRRPGLVYSDQALWPDNVRWIAVYAVTGGSEGHYIHVDAIHDVQHTAIGSVRIARGLMLAKTFRGIEHATALAARIAQLLGV